MNYRQKAVLEALTDAVDPPTAERDCPNGSIYARAAHRVDGVNFDTPPAVGWMGPKPYTGHWVRWCASVDAVIDGLVASGAVAVYATPTCWAWGDGLVRGSARGYWLTSRTAPKHSCKPWAPLQLWDAA